MRLNIPIKTGSGIGLGAARSVFYLRQAATMCYFCEKLILRRFYSKDDKLYYLKKKTP